MKGYTQLTRDERYQIYALRKAGHSQKEIAEVLRRNPSTISRELGRNKGLKGYRPEQAHRLAQNRKKERDRTRIPESTWARVEQLLREDWSPEQISGWLTRQASLRSRERFWDIRVPKIDSIFDNSLVRPGHPAFRHNIASSLRLHTGLPYDWTPRSDAPLGSPLAPSARRVSRVASRLPGTTRLRFALHGGQRRKAYRSAMKGFTSMSMRTSDAVAISIVIYAARSHAGSAMAITTDEGRSGNGCPSMNGRRWSRRAAALVIGKRTR